MKTKKYTFTEAYNKIPYKRNERISHKGKKGAWRYKR